MAIDIEAPGANEAALAAALKGLVGQPTRTVQALSGTSLDVAIPAGCTWFRVHTTVAFFGYLQLVYGATVQLWTSPTGTNQTAFCTGLGGSRLMYGTVWSPRDATKRTLAEGITTGESRRAHAESIQDDDTLRFNTASGTMSGNAEIEWFYN